jgi:GntR family transcriptional repressor for pyruvate dehydrogenase complex
MQTSSSIHPGVEQLIGFISGQKLSVGERLPPIKALAKTFGMQPHAVRDCILRAQTIGLLRVRPRSGVYVESVDFAPHASPPPSPQPAVIGDEDASLLDVLEARRLIESELAGVAAARRRLSDLVPVRDSLQQMYADIADYQRYIRHNADFHLRIAAIAGNQVLLNMLRQLIGPMGNVLLQHQPPNWHEAACEKRDTDVREHEAIYRAILAGDQAGARAAMQTHLRDTTDSLIPKYIQGDIALSSGTPSVTT